MVAPPLQRDTNGGWADATSDLGDFGFDQTHETDEQKQTKFAHHTNESAGHRCVALVPKGLKAELPTDVLLHHQPRRRSVRGLAPA